MPAKTSKATPPAPNTRTARTASATKLAKTAKIGRPLAKIDEALVARLAFNGLSNRMIAVLVGVNDKTIASRFSALLAKKRAERCLMILERQWEILNGAAGPHGATTMAIWLGKNELGQTDKRQLEHSGGLSVKVNITAYKEETPKLAEDKSVIDVTEVQQANRLLEGPAEPSSPKSQRRMDAT